MTDQKQDPEIIGIISISEKTPATPISFNFWSKDDESIPLEPGRIITAIHPEMSAIKAIGIIDNLYATRDINSPLDSYYAHGYGNPHQEMATHQDVIRVASVEVVRRSDGKNQPVSGSWQVRFAKAKEIEEAYGADIKKEKALLAGYAMDAYEQPVPIRLDSRFVLGYEGAHVNIAGASGLATKTSYALFLIYSILAYSKKDPSQKVAAIAFNVKEADLLRIDNLPRSWKECFDLVRQKFPEKSDLYKILWEQAKSEGIDPYQFKDKLRFFAPAKKENCKLTQSIKKHGKKLEPYYYGLGDLIHTEDELSLEILFNLEDLDEKLSGVIYAATNELQSQKIKRSFNVFLGDLWKKVNDPKSRRDINIGTTSQHKDTVIRFLRRLTSTVNYQLAGLLTLQDAEGNPIPVEEIGEDELWVVDIRPLHEKGQRMVFLSLIDRLARLLEAKKNGENQVELYKDGPKVDLKNFPDKVVVFVDELNKFAPASSARIPLRSRIVDITSRGRSYGLSLIGAQQLASQVEEQVLANTSTFVVGRTHSVEIKNRPYQWLGKGLQDKASIMDKGQMFIWHAVHARPALITFPIPIHQLLEE